MWKKFVEKDLKNRLLLWRTKDRNGCPPVSISICYGLQLFSVQHDKRWCKDLDDQKNSLFGRYSSDTLKYRTTRSTSLKFFFTSNAKTYMKRFNVDSFRNTVNFDHWDGKAVNKPWEIIPANTRKWSIVSHTPLMIIKVL